MPRGFLTLILDGKSLSYLSNDPFVRLAILNLVHNLYDMDIRSSIERPQP